MEGWIDRYADRWLDAPTTFRSMSGFALPSMAQRQTSPLGFLFLNLPPPPCAALLFCIIHVFSKQKEDTAQKQ